MLDQAAPPSGSTFRRLMTSNRATPNQRKNKRPFHPDPATAEASKKKPDSTSNNWTAHDKVAAWPPDATSTMKRSRMTIGYIASSGRAKSFGPCPSRAGSITYRLLGLRASFRCRLCNPRGAPAPARGPLPGRHCRAQQQALRGRAVADVSGHWSISIRLPL